MLAGVLSWGIQFCRAYDAYTQLTSFIDYVHDVIETQRKYIYDFHFIITHIYALIIVICIAGYYKYSNISVFYVACCTFSATTDFVYIIIGDSKLHLRQQWRHREVFSGCIDM